MASPMKGGYVHSLDWVRALTIVAVVFVHAIRFALVPSQPVTGNWLQLLFQFGRESFMVVTGFIIAYQYHNRSPNWARFFKRRGKSALLPYLIWLAVFLIPEVPIWHPLRYGLRYLHILGNGNGHLYYMIIALQMYLLAPLLVLALGRLSRWHWPLAGLSVLWEGVSWTLTGYFHTNLSPSLFVTTYLGYFVIGGVLGFHWAEVKGWLSVRRNWLVPGMLVAILAASLAFVYDLHQFGRPAAATNVFQPLSVVYTLAVFLVLLASGTWFEEVRPTRQRLGRVIKMVADASFGIYLVHPLFVHGWLSFAGSQGYAINPYLNTVLTGGFGVVCSIAAVFLIRQLPFSEAVIGTVRLDRKKLAAVFHSAPSEHRPAVGDR